MAELVIIFKPNYINLKKTHPLEYCEDHLDNPEDRSDEPDVDDGEEGEDEAPEDGHGDGDDRGDNLVDPQLGVGEYDEGQAPDGIESMGGRGFS